jgi:hypothetical protein
MGKMPKGSLGYRGTAWHKFNFKEATLAFFHVATADERASSKWHRVHCAEYLGYRDDTGPGANGSSEPPPSTEIIYFCSVPGEDDFHHDCPKVSLCHGARLLLRFGISASSV